jgi:hypothetical protein
MQHQFQVSPYPTSSVSSTGYITTPVNPYTA